MSYLEEVDIPSAKERFMNNEALYKKFLYRFPDNTLMSDLEQHLADRNLDEAFRDAHTMKGMVGNLSLYKLMNAASKMTEVLRVRQLPEESELNELKKAFQSAVDAVIEIKDKDIQLF